MANDVDLIEPLSVETLGQMTNALAKRVRAMREDGEMLSERLELLNQWSVRAVHDATDLRERLDHLKTKRHRDEVHN